MKICQVVDRLSLHEVVKAGHCNSVCKLPGKGQTFLRNVATHHGLADIRCGTNVTQSGATMKYFLREILMAT